VVVPVVSEKQVPVVAVERSVFALAADVEESVEPAVVQATLSIPAPVQELYISCNLWRCSN
jgi:hypothetical protein